MRISTVETHRKANDKGKKKKLAAAEFMEHEQHDDDASMDIIWNQGRIRGAGAYYIAGILFHGS